jgi:hypothetical protein
MNITALLSKSHAPYRVMWELRGTDVGNMVPDCRSVPVRPTLTEPIHGGESYGKETENTGPPVHEVQNICPATRFSKLFLPPLNAHTVGMHIRPITEQHGFKAYSVYWVRLPGCRPRGPGFDSRRCQIIWVAVGLERRPLSPCEDKWGATWKKSSGSGLENWD